MLECIGRIVYRLPTRAKRDKSYYQNRIAAEHPSLAKDVADGKINLWDAVDQAGPKNRPKASNLLKRDWRNPSSAEHQEFICWLADTLGVTITTPSMAPSSVQKSASTPVITPHASASTLTDDDNRLTASARSAIKDLLTSRSLSIGDLMREIGERPLDQSVSMALHRNTRLMYAPVREGLTRWLNKHGYNFL